MGSLLRETPHSETNATLELLDRWGVTREGLKRLRSASPDEQRAIAQMIERGISSDDGQKITVARNSILEYVMAVVMPTPTKKFVAKEKFMINTKRNAEVMISYLGDNFKAWFLFGGGKIEDPIAEHTLRYHKLLQSSTDGPIITELGGAVKALTTLSEMFSLMVGQKYGEDGALLINGYANIFYIKDSALVLRTVGVRWGGDGWHVNASSVGHRNRWGDGSQVFSRAT